MGAAQSQPVENSPTSNTSSNVTVTQTEQSTNRIKDGIIDSIQNLWLSGQHTNLTVHFGNDVVKCHSFILCACSDYFARLLLTEHGDNNERRVTLNLCSKTTFEQILEMLYTGNDLITGNNVTEIWLASHDLEIGFLVKECEEFILRHLSIGNFTEIHKHAVCVRSTRILQKTRELMQRNFTLFIKSQTFLELSYDDFIAILKSQDLTVPSEDTIIDAILKWVRHVPEQRSMGQYVERKDFLGELFSASRLSLVSPTCIEMLLKCETVQEHSKTKAAVDRAIIYQLHVGKRHGQWPLSAIHRNSSNFKNVVIAGSFDGSISVLSLPDYEDRHEVSPFSAFKYCRVTLTVFDNTIYALSSPESHCVNLSGDLSSEEKLKTITNNQVNVNGQLYVLKNWEWQKVTSVPGTQHILVPHGESLYFFQPVTRKVQKLDHSFEGKVLELLDPVPSQGIITSVIPLDTHILVLFPKLLSSTTETTVHCLNTATKKWSRVNNLRGPAAMSSFKVGEDTYILQNNGAVSKVIYTHGGRVDFMNMEPKLWNGQWQLSGCVSLGHSLFICGSHNTNGAPVDRSCSLDGIFDDIIYVNDSFDFFLPAIVCKNTNNI